MGHRIAWDRRFSWREAEKLVASNLGTVLGQPGLAPGNLKSLQVLSRGESGRVEWLEVGTSRGTYLVRGDAVRWLFGNGRAGPSGLRSSDFQLTVERDRKGRPRAVVVKGKGHGHGIGLCQWGARGRAQSGQTAEEILSAYYPGAEVVDLRTPAGERSSAALLCPERSRRI
jgi:stage II sporulation protein D